MFFLQLVISVVISMFTAPKPVTPKPATLDSFDMPTAEPGRNLPIIFGEVLMEDPNVVWYGDLGYRKIKSKSGK